MSFTMTMLLVAWVKSALLITSSRATRFPCVRKLSAFATRSGVFSRPSRSGSSPSSTRSWRTRAAILAFFGSIPATRQQFSGQRHRGQKKRRPKAPFLGCFPLLAAASGSGLRLLRRFHARRNVGDDRLRRLRLADHVIRKAGAGRNQAPDDHVLLEAAQLVALAHDRRLGQHAGRLLERRRRDERIGG